jgi:hypothetical protein
MKKIFVLVVLTLSLVAVGSGQNSCSMLSDEDIAQAREGKGKEQQVRLTDVSGVVTRSIVAGLLNSDHTNDVQIAQNATLTIYSALAVIAIRQASAKKQFLDYQPSEEDERRSFTLIASGFEIAGTASSRTYISRIVLLSDPSGKVVEEAYLTKPLDANWSNAFGANHGQSFLAKFSMESVENVKEAAANGEFVVAVFSGESMTKMYKVKTKHQTQLGLDQPNKPSSKPCPLVLNAVNRQDLKANVEAAGTSDAMAAAIAHEGHQVSKEELAERIKQGLASRCAVITSPSGAEVYIDGNKASVTPMAFILSKRDDSRVITIKLAGYETVERKVDPDGKDIPIALHLVPIK